MTLCPVEVCAANPVPADRLVSPPSATSVVRRRVPREQTRQGAGETAVREVGPVVPSGGPPVRTPPGRPLHHAPEAAARRRDGAGELLRLRRARARREAGAVPLAAAAEARFRPGPARALLHPAAAHDDGGGRAGNEARRQAEGQSLPG